MNGLKPAKLFIEYLSSTRAYYIIREGLKGEGKLIYSVSDSRSESGLDRAYQVLRDKAERKGFYII